LARMVMRQTQPRQWIYAKSYWIYHRISDGHNIATS
jgi:hypothetical protein